MPRKTTITVVEAPKIVTIDNTLSIKEVEKSQLKVIENSEAWKEHQKQHADAKLQLASEKKEGGFEALLQKQDNKLLKAAGMTPEAKPDEADKKKKEDSFGQVDNAYTRGGNIEAKKGGNIYSGGHDHGTIMASCTCGQTFKSDEDGKTATYKLKSEEAVQAISVDKGYKKNEDTNVRGYKHGADTDDSPRNYGRR